MIQYHEIDPIIFRIGPLAVRWYGMMYLLGFGSSFALIRYRLNRERNVMDDARVEDVFFYLVVGLVVGARVGYMLFYNLGETIRHPLSIVEVWNGGMSFHGGLIGAITAGLLFCRKNRIAPLPLADVVMITAPIGLAFGRLGNFINGELWGRPADVPWAMMFPGAGHLPRHPSQLYELALEGIALFMIMWFTRKRFSRPGQSAGIFLLGYGIFRSACEFFREPDPQLGFLFGLVTMGQILSAVMMAAGAYLLFTRRHTTGASQT